ncbi:hypothetical protein SM007_28020 [Streptomyces avermitilis]|uniref:Uncharacterized protein n=1 Tax=Streptomyces avermitilis TaxID=33903 RepID=A0A4D4MAC1_STRAX|nr:hypothetical protein [Streptomyces avermitilis]OOV24721.1 hypothetical protein SM007_28020 [Streptomyces avermitilis]GDY68836.1 hypothetical protein SAV14893_082290 [Streptomyces avermitilis]GDY70781.1 hypothetical protein SAV31267_002660 [Streptomyces avermitilis]
MTAELSGVDLAHQALAAARDAVTKNGTTRKKEKPKRRTGRVVRRDGREPLGLGSAISMMMTERSMVAPPTSGSVLADFGDMPRPCPSSPDTFRPWGSTRTPVVWTSSPRLRHTARSCAGAHRR